MRAFFSTVLVLAFLPCLLKALAVHAGTQAAAEEMRTTLTLRQAVNERTYSLEADFRARASAALAASLAAAPTSEEVAKLAVCAAVAGWSAGYVAAADYSPVLVGPCPAFIDVDLAQHKAKIGGRLPLSGNSRVAFFRHERVGDADITVIVPEGTTIDGA
jgi:hypothetical protein